MKIIKIFSENSEIVEIRDGDDSDLQSYAKSLSPLLESNNISILHTTTTSIILKPSKINLITVEDEPQTNKTIIVKHSKSKSDDSQTEDIITDAEE